MIKVAEYNLLRKPDKVLKGGSVGQQLATG
ncbi:predicted protein [Sclerotinia sclerotiorum 1980 UF-70]|uniref:Uncharacterized protein n=1 Tax=Sclerotinia sclerotiorum (strain ATCC 18683 / 1980 / Ss-1) TaxID=665079 RepID=A7F1M4_SCLS1|nr:predicted protein [Sclerotinia sclerotiorum 1980 UF-70]EDN95616.1 predicted protein [Sclerotinia sclerotiorum 1980 UF-70]